MDGYFFNEKLFKNLNVVLEMKVRQLIRSANIPENTWINWRRNSDLPLAALIKLCNTLRIPIAHFICAEESKDLMLGKRHYIVKEEEFKENTFLNIDFGEEVTTVVGRHVLDLCAMIGMSPGTFYSNFRYTNSIKGSFGVKSWLNICNKTKTYPMDFLLSYGGGDVPVLEGFSRRREWNSDVMSKRSVEMASHNTLLVRKLKAEREKVKALEKEVERLKSALLEKRQEIVVLQGELDDKRMMAAEEGNG